MNAPCITATRARSSRRTPGWVREALRKVLTRQGGETLRLPRAALPRSVRPTRTTGLALLVLASGSAMAAPGIKAPPSATAGSTITLQATGSGDPREFVTVVAKG